MDKTLVCQLFISKFSGEGVGGQYAVPSSSGGNMEFYRILFLPKLCSAYRLKSIIHHCKAMEEKEFCKNFLVSPEEVGTASKNVDIKGWLTGVLFFYPRGFSFSVDKSKFKNVSFYFRNSVMKG